MEERRAPVSRLNKALIGGALALGLLQSVQAGQGIDPSENLILQWNDAVIQAIRDTRTAPPIAARAMAIVNTCAFDAWSAYVHNARATRSPRNFKIYTKSPDAKIESVARAAYLAARDLFRGSSQQAYFDAVLAAQGYKPDTKTTDLKTPAGVANVACSRVLAYRHQDQSNQLGEMNGGVPYSDWTGYQPVNTPDHVADPNRWQPLRVPNGQGGYTEQKFLTPHWGQIKPFALRDWHMQVVDPIRQSILRGTGRVGPAMIGEPEYDQQSQIQVSYSGRLSDQQKVIAEYWADGPGSETPPGHWMALAQNISKRDQHTFDEDVKLMFALSNTLFDTSIACWGAKVMFDSARPITTIRYLYAGQKIKAWAGPGRGTRTIAGEEFQPYQSLTFVTPPFAEYPSGHSAFSAAAAEVLKKFTGSDYFGHEHLFAAGTSRIEPGVTPGAPVTLSWSTFTEAADEAGMSRRYGGIHFVDGDIDSRRFGRRTARIVWHKAQYHFGY
jgi:hypothetical protein